MNCTEAKNKIVLWEELSLDEQTKLRHHLDDCGSCRAAFEERQHFTNLIRTMSAPPRPAHHAALTRQIMDAVAREKSPGQLTRLDQWLGSKALRLGLAGLSALLIAVFAIEYPSALQSPERTVTLEATETRLHSSEFLKAVRDRDKTDALTYHDVIACREDKSCDDYQTILSR